MHLYISSFPQNVSFSRCKHVFPPKFKWHFWEFDVNSDPREETDAQVVRHFQLKPSNISDSWAFFNVQKIQNIILDPELCRLSHSVHLVYLQMCFIGSGFIPALRSRLLHIHTYILIQFYYKKIFIYLFIEISALKKIIKSTLWHSFSLFCALHVCPTIIIIIIQI